ncbi:hypothetical protein AB0F30_35270 [Streptomyces sp. NPDC029006]
MSKSTTKIVSGYQSAAPDRLLLAAAGRTHVCLKGRRDGIPRAERHPGIGRWLLAAVEDPLSAEEEWEGAGLTYVPCGGLFTAIRVPGFLVHAAVQSREPAKVDAFLADALAGGPVIASPGLSRYYVLVPAGAAQRWRHSGMECLPNRTLLAVPAMTLTTYRPGVHYWSVLPETPGGLCSLGRVDALTRYGQRRWAEGRR